MADWWNGFKRTGNYKMYSKEINCAGVVITALKKGGAEAYAAVPTIKTFATPEKLESWALHLYAVINYINIQTYLYEQKANTVLGHRQGQAGNELMTAKSWGNYIWWGTSSWGKNKLTDRNRMSTITPLLKAYHRLNWNTADTLCKKLEYLRKIMEKLMAHYYATHEKPWIYAAVLGKQIINVLKSDDVTKR